MTTLGRGTWVEINLENVAHNLRAIRARHGENVRCAAVVKANAYGHGAVGVAKAAVRAGATSLCVATVPEALELRDEGVYQPILILGPVLPAQTISVVDKEIAVAVYDELILDWLSEAVSRSRSHRPAKVHLKVDTGMTRLGVDWTEALRLVERAYRTPGIEVEGIYTHLAEADTADRAHAYDQFEHFMNLLDQLEKKKMRPPIAHIANSAAAIDMPEMGLDMIRLGISLYGFYSSEFVSRTVELKPVLRWVTHVAQAKRVKAGARISYGGTYTAERDTTIAVLPVGYADGYRRSLSNKGSVLIGGQKYPIAGRVCMDLIMADVGDAPLRAGDEAVLIGRQGESEITADELAGLIDTINYEVTTNISPRVERIYGPLGWT